MKIRRTVEDDLFSKAVRERANWMCERCLTSFASEPGKLHCSHVFGRRNRSTRWWPDNAFALCWGCHRHFTENPISHAEFVKQRLGCARYEELRVRANTPVKFSKADIKDLRAHLREELARMQQLRAEGKTCRLVFNPWNVPTVTEVSRESAKVATD